MVLQARSLHIEFSEKLMCALTDAPGYLQLYCCQGLPGAPNNLRFSDITMSSLMVSWDRPKKRNGEIIGYIVSYETAEQNERK